MSAHPMAVLTIPNSPTLSLLTSISHFSLHPTFQVSTELLWAAQVLASLSLCLGCCRRGLGAANALPPTRMHPLLPSPFVVPQGT